MWYNLKVILIRQAHIVDGSGAKPYRADILIDRKKIAAIGNFANRKADRIINGLGLTATPGFIDVNADIDHYLSLFTNPGQADLLTQGVTTVIGGQCGSSLAPLMYGSLAAVRRWASTDQVNVDWHTVAELLRILKHLPRGVNFGTLIGHFTIRRDIAGEAFRDLTESELAVFENLVRQALKDGALGLSNGFGYLHDALVPYFELERLAKLTAKAGKPFVTHMRDEQDGLTKSVDEILQLARSTSGATIISHLQPYIGAEPRYMEALGIIDKNLTDANVYFELNPLDENVVPGYALLPDWVRNNAWDNTVKELESADVRNKISRNLKSKELIDLTIAYAHNQPHLDGKRLVDLARDLGKDLPEAALELLVDNRLRVMFVDHRISFEALQTGLFHKRALIASYSAGLPWRAKDYRLQRDVATFTRFLDLAAANNVPIEEAVKKITSVPASVFGIAERGMLQVGMVADLVLLRDHAPVHVLVNGDMAVDEGKVTGQLSGTTV